MTGLFDQWHLYSVIVDRDYMQHREISSRVRARLSSMGDLSTVVDLGCGDGTMARECLRDHRVEHYVGLDLSADALHRLRGRPAPGLGDRPARLDLHQVDMIQALQEMPRRSVDLVLASFSLHHLDRAQKVDALRQLVPVLKPGALFLWTDSVRKSQEDRAAFLLSLEKEIRSHWLALTAEEVEHTVRHIHESDFPEDEPWMLAETFAAGLSHGERLHREGHFGAWCFTAP